MCNYLGYDANSPYVKLRQIELRLDTLAPLQKMRSGFDYDEWPTISRNRERNNVELKMMHWEFIPPYVNCLDDLKLIRKGIDPKTGAKKAAIPWLNAKAENLLVNDKGRKSMWADSARNRRCLVKYIIIFRIPPFNNAAYHVPLIYFF